MAKGKAVEPTNGKGGFSKKQKISQTREKFVGFWDRDGALQGCLEKRIETKNENVFYLLRVMTGEGTATENKSDDLISLKPGDLVAVGECHSLQCLADFVGKPGQVRLESQGKIELDNGNSFWEIDVYYDADAPMHGQQILPGTSDGEKQSKPNDDLPF